MNEAMSSGRVRCTCEDYRRYGICEESRLYGLLFLQKLPTDDCIAGVSTDWEDSAKVIFSKIRQETNFGVGHDPKSTKTDPWTSSSVENRIHRQMRGKF